MNKPMSHCSFEMHPNQALHVNSKGGVKCHGSRRQMYKDQLKTLECQKNISDNKWICYVTREFSFASLIKYLKKSFISFRGYYMFINIIVIDLLFNEFSNLISISNLLILKNLVGD